MIEVNRVSYYANGELKVVFLKADADIITKVKEVFEQYEIRYDFDSEVSEDSTTVEAWGNDPYSYGEIEEILEIIKQIAPIKDGSEFDFCGEDKSYWRFIFENGRWKEQDGEIVYHD